MRFLLTIVAYFDLEMRQFDAVAAFLNARSTRLFTISRHPVSLTQDEFGNLDERFMVSVEPLIFGMQYYLHT